MVDDHPPMERAAGLMDRCELEAEEKWREISAQVPAITFLPEWQVKIIPPFGGAVARFIVGWAGGSVSVYLDWYDRLGYMGHPYWEIHPAHDGDTARFVLSEAGEMVEAIAASLARQATQIKGEAK